MNAIPTHWQGVNFRSRLEAKWAAFFSGMGWDWEYEPCDFGGWIPDFFISGTKGGMYVEVKPFCDSVPDEVTRKIVQSGVDKEVLIVGISNPVWTERCRGDSDGLYQIGWMLDDFSIASRDTYLDRALLGVSNPWRSIDATGWDIGGWEQSFRGRLNGEYDGHQLVLDFEGRSVFSKQAARRVWNQATNEVQWRRVNPEILRDRACDEPRPHAGFTSTQRRRSK